MLLLAQTSTYRTSYFVLLEYNAPVLITHVAVRRIFSWQGSVLQLPLGEAT